MQAEQSALSEPDSRQKEIPAPPFAKIRNVISRLRLFPKTHDFFGYFEKSSENIVDGAKILCEMFAKKDDRAALVKKLKDCEHIGDKYTHAVIDLLHQTFLTPFDRSDIHTLVVKMDDIIDIINFIGNRLSRYNVTQMPPELPQLADIVLSATQEISKAVAGLRNLKNVKKVINHCIEVNSLENEADDKINSIIGTLFSNGWDPIQVIKLKELAENMELATDKCEDVANIIENIILKHT